MRAQLDPKALASRQIGIDEVAIAIDETNVNLPTGTLDGTKQAFTIEANGQLFKASAYRQMVVAYREGSPVRLEELGRVIERSLRRAGLKPAFSAGYHPMPLISFGRALPVGVSSQAEWLGIFLREAVSPDDFTARLNPNLPEGLVVVEVEELAGGRKVAHPVLETFELTVPEAVPPFACNTCRILPGPGLFP